MKRIIPLLILMASCTGNTQTEKEKPDSNINPIIEFLHEKDTTNTGNLPVLDLQKKYPQRFITLQDIADVEYIVLETHDDGLIAGSHCTTITDSLIITMNTLTDNVIFFKRDGTFSHSFNRKGNSGTEYSSMGFNLCINPHTQEVYVYDFLRRRIQVYTYEGEYKRTLKIGGDGFSSGQIYYINSESLLAEDNMNVDYESKVPTNPKPYYKISINDGAKSRLPITIANRIRNGLSMYDEEADKGISIGVSILPVSTINEELIISEFSLDTIYKYQDNSLVPIARKENWMKDNGIPYIVAPDAMTDDFFLWHAIEKDFKKTILPTKTYLQNRHTGKCIQIKLVDKNITDKHFDFRHRMTASKHVLPKNSVLQFYSAYRLKEFYESGKLTGELKEIAARLNEDDNPVLMLAKFK